MMLNRLIPATYATLVFNARVLDTEEVPFGELDP